MRPSRNRAKGNRDDGIDAESAATTVIGNVANNNHDLGIDAVPGVVGVGNKASGNGNPLVPCLNVVCNEAAAAPPAADSGGRAVGAPQPSHRAPVPLCGFG